MKVERKKSFTPVVITLETEEEFKAVRIALGATTYNLYSEETDDKIEADLLTDTAYDIYVQLCNIVEEQ